MKIRYSEDPSTWRKSVGAGAAACSLVIWLLGRSGRLSSEIAWGMFVAVAVGALLVAIRAAWARGYYRSATSFGHFMGRWVGGFLMGLIFCLLVTPLGLALRVCGKDVLGIRWRERGASYWVGARGKRGRFDRMF